MVKLYKEWVEFEDDAPEEFQIGDMVTKVSAKEILRWNDWSGERTNKIRNSGAWIKTYSITSPKKVVGIDYCDDLDGYTGQVVQLQNRWPWYQVTNLEKV
jgi:hypothetical protein